MATTAGRRSWLVLAGLGMAVALNPTGCGKAGPADSGGVDAEMLAEVLAAVGPQVVEPALARFVDQANALGEAVLAWSGSQDEADQASAQEAWLAAFSAWQELELMQIGPAASSLSARGGEDLRDEIYSWPSASGCRVDQETVAGTYEDGGFFEASLVNAYGLDAAEHLLFFGLDNDCPGQVEINSDGSWDALGDAGVIEARSTYAVVVADELYCQALGLQGAWSKDGGDFSGALSLDNDTTPYETSQSALNAVYDALFYLETKTKDRKLAQPLGLQECGEATCPQDVEALTSGAGLLAIEANLVGFRNLLTGGEGEGLDDLLVDLGHEDLANQLLTATDASLSLVGTMQGDLDLLIETEPASVQALHDAIKQVTDLVKGDLSTVLLVQIPTEAAGDND